MCIALSILGINTNLIGKIGNDYFGESIEESIRIACVVGGQNIQAFEVITEIKTWKEKLAMISEWDRNRIEVAGDCWRYEKRKVKIGKKDRRY